MEKNKYYTPSIEEFHVGFEFEFKPRERSGIIAYIENRHSYLSKCFKKTKTIKEILLNWYDEPTALNEIGSYIIDKAIRVKYLDKKDIESLGWKFEKQHAGLDDMTFSKEELTLDFEDIEGIRDRVRIYEFNGDTDLNYFCGTIKNKSELKVLMKQLRI